MPIGAAVGGGASLLGSFLQSNTSKNAAKADEAQQSSLDNYMVGIYNNLMGKYNSVFNATQPATGLNEASNFYKSEIQGGLSPAVIGAANSNFQQENAQNLSTLKNQLGPYTPNMAGTISDFENSEITGNVSLQQQLAAMNQQTRASGAAGLAGIDQGILNWGSSTAGGVASGVGGLASEFGGAAAQNTQNAWSNNPFSSIASWMSMYPNLFNPGGSSGNTQPGQGGLGSTGGTGSGGGGGPAQNPGA
jgi:hypothetical protein